MTERADLRSGRINKAIFVIMIVFSIGIFISIIFWFIPREIVTLELTVDPPMASREGTIKLHSTVETFVNGKSNYETTLVCDSGRYFIVAFNAITQPSPPSQETIPITVPESVPVGDECHLETEGQHAVEVLPFASRTYFTEFYSNKFIIEE